MTEELKFASSRAGAPAVALSDAIRQGLAPDGGLYVPTRLPLVDIAAHIPVLPGCRIGRHRRQHRTSPAALGASKSTSSLFKAAHPRRVSAEGASHR